MRALFDRLPRTCAQCVGGGLALDAVAEGALPPDVEPGDRIRAITCLGHTGEFALGHPRELTREGALAFDPLGERLQGELLVPPRPPILVLQRLEQRPHEVAVL